jgi:hypothetical protein
MVETEQSAEAHAPLHVGVHARGWRCSSQESGAESLMIPLGVAVRDVLVDEPT